MNLDDLVYALTPSQRVEIVLEIKFMGSSLKIIRTQQAGDCGVACLEDDNGCLIMNLDIRNIIVDYIAFDWKKEVVKVYCKTIEVDK